MLALTLLVTIAAQESAAQESAAQESAESAAQQSAAQESAAEEPPLQPDVVDEKAAPSVPPPAEPPQPSEPAPPTRPRCSMAVLDLEVAEGIPPTRASAWTDVVVQEMQAHSGCSVLSRADIRAVLSLEAEKSLLGCDDENSCLADLGDALGVSHLVTGRISRINDSVLLSLRKTDLRSMSVEARATDSFGGEDDEVFAFVGWLSRKLIVEDPAAVGDKPIPRPKEEEGPELVERRGTIWGTLAWTGVALTITSAVVFSASAGTTAYFSEQTKAAKLSTVDQSEFLDLATQAGPVLASVTNGALYAGSALLVATTGLFFLPHDEIVRVNLDDAAVTE